MRSVRKKKDLKMLLKFLRLGWFCSVILVYFSIIMGFWLKILERKLGLSLNLFRLTGRIALLLIIWLRFSSKMGTIRKVFSCIWSLWNLELEMLRLVLGLLLLLWYRLLIMLECLMINSKIVWNSSHISRLFKTFSLKNADLI